MQFTWEKLLLLLQFALIIRINQKNMTLIDLTTEQNIWNMANGIVSSKEEQSDNRRVSVRFFISHRLTFKEYEQRNLYNYSSNSHSNFSFLLHLYIGDKLTMRNLIIQSLHLVKIGTIQKYLQVIIFICSSKFIII